MIFAAYMKLDHPSAERKYILGLWMIVATDYLYHIGNR